MVNRLQIFLPSLPLSIFEYFRNCEREKDGMATIATRQLHSSSSPFPIEEEERTSLFQQDFIPLFQQFSSCTMVNRFQIFLPSLPLPIFKYFQNYGRERESMNRWWLLRRRKNKPFPTGFHPSPFQQFSSCTLW